LIGTAPGIPMDNTFRKDESICDPEVQSAKHLSKQISASRFKEIIQPTHVSSCQNNELSHSGCIEKLMEMMIVKMEKDPTHLNQERDSNGIAENN
jgi:hypothetical protein